jgi:Tol biopolymer transport system component
VLHERFLDGPPTVIAVDAEGRAEDFVTDALGAEVSRDGRTVVFRRIAPGLWKTDGAGARPVQLTSWIAFEPRVSPDGSQVVFLSSRDGNQSPWLSTDGGEPTRIAEDSIGFGGRFDLSPDGRRVMFVPSPTTEGDVRVSVCDLPACSDRREIYAPEGATRPFRFTQDGAAIAYVDQIGTNLWALPLDGGSPRQITSFPASATGGVIANYAWSNDGTRLAFARQTIAEDIVLLRDVQP